ncbi:hypothetical protein JR316_0005446 [Psilocybe cubensis]|uniref:Uncharacterized protein n=1 Tax=Psilocybe cubensis TaxID=181762 RepID=A0ACB8H5S8_PSICU|nr:hypothetical protein JR316_0005446 [Psilocybe cubensis]KAH9483340.1 hypothetical protein JR316_0005446 [Psilocybe cubensis]
MNHSTNVGVSSAWTLSSSSSWGTASASGYSDCDSSSQSWGVDRGKTPFGSVSSVSLGPSGSTTSVPSPWGSQATLVNGGHALPPEASSSYSYTRYPGPSLSTASTTTLVNPPVGVQGDVDLSRNEKNHNLNPAVHGAGVRRIDALGRRTKFAGFKPTGGANGWIIYFSN